MIDTNLLQTAISNLLAKKKPTVPGEKFSPDFPVMLGDPAAGGEGRSQPPRSPISPQLPVVTQPYRQAMETGAENFNPEPVPTEPVVLDNSTRPRLAPQLPAPTETVTEKIPDPGAVIEQADKTTRPRIAGDDLAWQRNQYDEWITNPELEKAPENQPKRWKAILGSALAAISEAMRNNGGDLAGALGEGLGEGIGAGIYPKIFADRQHRYKIGQIDQKIARRDAEREKDLSLQAKEAQLGYLKQRPEIERDKLKNRVELEKIKQENRIATIKLQDMTKGDDWDSFIRDGKVWKLYKKRDGSDGRSVVEPLIDPDTGKQMTPAEDQLYDYYDNYSGQTIKTKGRDLIAGGNANASRETSVNLANTAAQNRYQNDVFDWQNQVTTAGGDVSVKDSTLAGLYTKDGELSRRQEALQAEINSMQGDLMMSEQLKAKQGELAKITGERTNLSADIEKSKGELQKAKEIWETRKKNKPRAPQTAQAVVTGGKGKYSGMTVKLSDAKSYFPNKTDAEIKQIIEANGGKVIN